jgi:hypothetical protein
MRQNGREAVLTKPAVLATSAHQWGQPFPIMRAYLFPCGLAFTHEERLNEPRAESDA